MMFPLVSVIGRVSAPLTDWTRESFFLFEPSVDMPGLTESKRCGGF